MNLFSDVGKDSLVLEEDSVSRVLENFASSRKAERLSIECQKPEYSLPCKPKQKWHCILKDNRFENLLYFVFFIFQDYYYENVQ